MRRAVIPAGLAILAATTPALAAPAPAATFALLDATGDDSKLELSLATMSPVRRPGEDVGLRGDLQAQWIAPQGFGGYASLGVAGFLYETEGVAVGSVQLGAQFLFRRPDRADLGIRLGVALPTEDHELDIGIATANARPADLATAIHGVTWLRLGVSPTMTSGATFARLDAGLDIPVTISDEYDAHDVPWIGHINVGVGVHVDRVAITGEVQTVIPDASGGGLAVGVAARYRAVVSPFLALSAAVYDEVPAFLVATVGATLAM